MQQLNHVDSHQDNMHRNGFQ